MPIVDLDPTRYVIMFLLLIEQLLNLNFCTGIARQLSQQEPEPEPDFEAASPVTVIDEDEDGEDIAGPTVEAHVELAKTICE